MKTAAKFLLMAVLVAGITSCSAEKRAARRVRRAVAECPELVQVKAHPIAGTVTAPGFADVATLPLAAVLQHDTLYAATQHGTVVVSLRQSDSALRVGFVAAPRDLHYADTLYSSQVVLNTEPKAQAKGGGVAWVLLAVVSAFGAGLALCFHLLRNALKYKRQKP